MDQQVKVSGYRVDMVEVETALRACGGVRIIDVAVVAVESPDVGQQLVAHVVLDATTRDGEGAASVATTIKQELGETLPAYAVPQLLRVWDSLPLNAHGKVDRHWLSTAPADSPV
jgi:acyl-coenzyme A synthetase/AMP-(fatty) acid ligase